MDHRFSNIGAFIKGARAATASATAAGTGDNTETTGPAIDRYVNGSNAAAGVFNSGTLMIAAQATLTEAKTLKVKATVQESSDNAVADAYADVAAASQPEAAADGVRAADALVITLTGAAGGSTETGFYQTDISFEGLERYLKFQVHQDLDAGATDTSFYAAVIVLGGVSQLPV